MTDKKSKYVDLAIIFIISTLVMVTINCVGRAIDYGIGKYNSEKSSKSDTYIETSTHLTINGYDLYIVRSNAEMAEYSDRLVREYKGIPLVITESDITGGLILDMRQGEPWAR